VEVEVKVLSVPGTREEYRKFLAELPSPEERIWYREYYSEQLDKYSKHLGYVNDVLFGSSPVSGHRRTYFEYEHEETEIGLHYCELILNLLKHIDGEGIVLPQTQNDTCSVPVGDVENVTDRGTGSPGSGSGTSIPVRKPRQPIIDAQYMAHEIVQFVAVQDENDTPLRINQAKVVLRQHVLLSFFVMCYFSKMHPLSKFKFSTVQELTGKVITSSQDCAKIVHEIRSQIEPLLRDKSAKRLIVTERGEILSVSTHPDNLMLDVQWLAQRGGGSLKVLYQNMIENRMG